MLKMVQQVKTKNFWLSFLRLDHLVKNTFFWNLRVRGTPHPPKKSKLILNRSLKSWFFLKYANLIEILGFFLGFLNWVLELIGTWLGLGHRGLGTKDFMLKEWVLPYCFINESCTFYSILMVPGDVVGWDGWPNTAYHHSVCSHQPRFGVLVARPGLSWYWSLCLW